MLVAPVSEARPRRAQRQQQFAVGRELADRVIEISRCSRRVSSGPIVNAVRARQTVLRPSECREVAVGGRDTMTDGACASEQKHPMCGIGGDADDFAQFAGSRHQRLSAR